MLKKSLFVASFVYGMGLLNAQQEQEPASQIETKYEVRNLQNHQLSTQALEELLVTIRAYVESKEVQNAQQMYELVTKIRQNEHNMHVFECYNVIRSFLRIQSLKKNVNDLVQEIERLINALIWFVPIDFEKSNGNRETTQKSFYSKSSNYLQHTHTLTLPNVFIHLTTAQQKSCMNIAKEISMVSNLYALGDDPLAEDGVIPTTAAFSHNIKIDQAIIDHQQKILDTISYLSKSAKSATKEKITSTIKKIVDIMNATKRETMTINLDGNELKFPYSKNLVREIRKEGGNVVTMLQNKLNSLSN